MTDHPSLSEQRADPFCLCCCRPRSAHLKRDLQCPETTYFIANEAAFAQPPASGVDRSREALHGARIWFELAMQDGDAGTDFLNEGGGWESAAEVLSDILKALTNSGAPVPGDAIGVGELAPTITMPVAEFRRIVEERDAAKALAHAAPAPSDGAPKREGVEAALLECVKRLEQTANRLGAYVEAYGLLHERDDEPLALAAVAIMEAREALNTPKQATPTDEAAVLADHIREQITHVQRRIEDGRAMGAAIWRIALEDVVRENKAILARPAPGSAGEVSDA